MKLLKNLVLNLILGLNVFILFFLLFEERIVLPPLLQVLGRMHPLFLHFPIVLLLAALLLELFRKQLLPEEQPRRRLLAALLYSGALTSAITVLCGLFLARQEGYEGSDTLFWHKWTGVAISFLAGLLVLIPRYSYAARRQGPLRAALGLACLTILVAGHLGASMTHGQQFLLEPILAQRQDQPIDLAQARLYHDLIQPVLREKCFSCHNPDKAKGELILTDTAALMAGGKNGALFLAGNPEESLLIERLLLDIDHKHHMPPKDKPQLSPEEIALIEAWVARGGDFHTTLAELPEDDTLHALARAVYGEGASEGEENFDFPPADPSLIAGLRSDYRVITPLGAGSPALDVSFFSSRHFSSEALRELEPLATQIVALNLSGMPLTAGDLDFLTRFTNLRQLNLNYVSLEGLPLEGLARLPHLRSLMLSGTPLKAEALDSLVTHPSLEHLYVWNTAVSAQQAQDWMKAHPSLRIETGFYDDGSLVLPLNEPMIEPARAFFEQPFELSLSHPIQGVQLRYTLDGSEPDSMASPLFEQPLPVRENTLVKVKAFKPGWMASPTRELHFRKVGIRPDSARLLQEPHPQYKARLGFSLFDLEDGSTDHQDGKWIGVHGQPLAAQWQFPGQQAVKRLSVSFLLHTRAHIFPPLAMEVWGGDDPSQLRLLARASASLPKEHMPPQKQVLECELPAGQPLRCMKILLQPLKQLPPWHPAKGQPAWIMVDEVLLD